MLLKKIIAISVFLAISNFGNTHKNYQSVTTLKNVAAKHKQLYSMSCIPMSIEMILKYNNKVSADYYVLQNSWKDKADGTFANFNGKTIAGLKFEHQFNIPRGNNFPITKLFKTIDEELTAGRKIVISLPSGNNFWHMYVIDAKTSNGDYMAYSRYFNENSPIAIFEVKKLVSDCKGTDILTYKDVSK